MAKVLTIASNMKCGHGGKATLSGSAKLTVNGKAVLLESDMSTWSIPPGCSQTKTDNGEVMCAKVVSITAGKSSKLSVSGKAVLTDDFAGTTNGLPDGLSISAESDQTILEAP